MKKLFVILVLVLFTITSSGDDSVFFELRMNPTVLIILDTSTSMIRDLYGPMYSEQTWGDGSLEYPGKDVNGDSLPNDSRLYNAKEAIRHVVENYHFCRFGLMTFEQDYWYGKTHDPGKDWYREAPYEPQNELDIWWHGGCGNKATLRVPIGDPSPEHGDSVIKWVDHQCNYDEIADGDHEVRANGYTPLAHTLNAAKDHFRYDVIPNDPAKDCRRYFVILLTDGAETCGGYPPGEAASLRNTIVGGDKYDVQTYVIAVSASEQNLDKCHAIAENGGTQAAHPCYNLAQLDSAFIFIMGDIEERAHAFSAPEVPAVRSKYYDKLYLGLFIPSEDVFWRGFLKCYQLADDGTIPVDTLGVPLEYPLWEAGDILKSKSSASRNIYTEMNGDLVPFNSSYVSADDLGVAPDSVDELINWVRGDNNKDWKLGDIYHSWPVVVGPPSPFYYDKGYDEFQQTYKHRDKVIFVGANAGMLHAFHAGTYVAGADEFTHGTGEELWAFIPNDLLGKLKNMRWTHEYYVDGSPQVADVWFPLSDADSSKDGNEWRTVLVCGERQGGNHYFALDVTDNRYPSFLWDFTDEHLGETWSQPAIGKIKVSESGAEVDRWVAIFGGGLSRDSVGTKGQSVYIVDIRNGSIIKEFSSVSMTHTFPSAPRLVDTNGDNYIDKIYIGDVGGRLFRYDISSASKGEWNGDIIFAAPEGNPIYYPPAASYDNAGNLWLFFGTGDRDEPRDTTDDNRFYGILDNGQTSPYAESDLGNVTISGEPTDNGWYISFVEQPGDHKGEKCLSSSDVFGNTVFFTTYQADSQDPCIINGIARYYKVDYTSGSAVDEERFTEIGTSLPTPPQITVSPEGNFVITISAGAEKLITESLQAPAKFKHLIYWDEKKLTK